MMVCKKIVVACVVFLCVFCHQLMASKGESSLPPSLTLPCSEMPDWVKEHGIVMAGNWEIPLNRWKSWNNTYEPTPDQLKGYEKERSVELLRQMRDEFGVNFIMTFLYKGFGMKAEAPYMQDAKAYAEMCHKEGLRVGAYIGGTLCWTLLKYEYPEWFDWAAKDAHGNALPYCQWRRYYNRNHPGLQAYLKPVIEFAVRDMKTDLIHLDNYEYNNCAPVGYDPYTIECFRQRLNKLGAPADFNVANFDAAMPSRDTSTALGRAWINFETDMLAESFYDVSKYARSLSPDILMECNPCGFQDRITVPTDHSRLLRYGEAVWDEYVFPGCKNGKAVTRQITYRTAQTMNNMVFTYITNPLEAAESLAYNTDCLGCIAWFEQGAIRSSWLPGSGPVSPAIKPYVRFFHEQRPYYRDIIRVADVASLRSFASQRFTPDTTWKSTSAFEQACIQSRVPWALIFDQHVDADYLKKFKAVSLIGADALTNKQIAQIRKYAAHGGGLIISEGVGSFDENMNPRQSNPLTDLSGDRIVRVKAGISESELLAAIKQSRGDEFSVVIDAPASVMTEITDQAKPCRRMVHLINYDTKTPISDIGVNVQLLTNFEVKRVFVIRPDAPAPEMLAFRQESDRLKVTVPHIELYGLVVVEAKDQ